MFFIYLFIFTLLFCSIFIEGKSRKKNWPVSAKNKKQMATVFPSKRSKHLKPLKNKDVVTKSKPVVSLKTLSNLNLLHKERKYNQEYLIEYKKMIRSLLPDAEMYEKFNSKEFLVLAHEIKTDKSLYSDKIAKLPICSVNRETNWKKVKVLQLEEKNSVILKENCQTGVKIVEKSMEGFKHFDKEINFFRHAHHGSKKYFPSFICSAKPKSRKGRYLITTDYVDGEKSHEMAAIATAEQLRFMVAQFFNSLVEMHKVGFVHCDLTPANVIVTKDFEVKLIDFGMAMPIGQLHGFRGSSYSRAPELHEMCPGKIDVGIDWWAFGCTVAIWYYYHFKPEMLKNVESTYNFTPMKLGTMKKFYSGVFPSQFPTELRKFLSLFLTIDPETRTFSTVRLQNMVRNHEFFKEFDWSIAEKY